MSGIKINKIIQELKRTDLSLIDANYLTLKMKRLHPSRIKDKYLFNPGWLGSFYRALPGNIQPGSEKPKYIKNLTYAPEDKLDDVRIGRANFARQPIFYCSDEERGTLFEIEPKAGEMVVISEWKVIRPIMVSRIGYDNKLFKERRSSRNYNVNSTINEIKYKSKLNNFLNTEFTKYVDDNMRHLYKMPASIANHFYLEDGYINKSDMHSPKGIAYPTLKMRCNTENFAFPPKLVDTSLIPVKAKWLKIIDYCDDSFSYGVELVSISDKFEDERIIWREPTNREKQRTANLKFAQTFDDF